MCSTATLCTAGGRLIRSLQRQVGNKYSTLMRRRYAFFATTAMRHPRFPLNGIKKYWTGLDNLHFIAQPRPWGSAMTLRHNLDLGAQLWPWNATTFLGLNHDLGHNHDLRAQPRPLGTTTTLGRYHNLGAQPRPWGPTMTLGRNHDLGDQPWPWNAWCDSLSWEPTLIVCCDYS